VTTRPGGFDPADVEALLATRRELGPGYDDALVESFVERIEHAVTERAQLHQRDAGRLDHAHAVAGKRQLALGIVSLVAFIPLGIVLGVTGQPAALLLVLAAIVAVNFAHAWQGRRL
jgi:hypothetical protein